MRRVPGRICTFNSHVAQTKLKRSKMRFKDFRLLDGAVPYSPLSRSPALSKESDHV